MKEAVGEKAFMLGNEAIARGVIEAGASVVAGYPGTPSTEIIETLASVAEKYGIYVEWSTNEKVAFEVATGAAISGLRALVSMKHAGVNWITDPLSAVTLSGVKGGLVIISADDPNVHSSANEQDNRFYGLFFKILTLEPSDPQEAKEMTKEAFDLSEEVELPVLVRSVTRVGHTTGEVVLEEPLKLKRKGEFKRDLSRFWISVGRALRRHYWLNEQQKKLQEVAERLRFNKLEKRGDEKIGVITSGVAYSYVKDALKILDVEDEVAVLKIGCVHPLPKGLVSDYLKSLPVVLVVEEGEPFLELQIKAVASEICQDANLQIFGKFSGDLRRVGELNTETVAEFIARKMGRKFDILPVDVVDLRKDIKKVIPSRSITFCAGCPHAATYYAIKLAVTRATRGKALIAGDIGCYSMGAYHPYSAGDIKYSMGASVGVASGLSRVLDEPIIAVIGDGTFFHAGIPELINAVYNGAKFTLVVLDNSIIAMTGFQPHPGVGITLLGKKNPAIKIEDIMRACGVDFIRVVDSYDIYPLRDAIEEAIRYDGLAVVISRRPCALQVVRKARREGERIIPYQVDPEKCTGCKICISRFACPAISLSGEKAQIDKTLCVGCGVCAKVCAVNAIVPTES